MEIPYQDPRESNSGAAARARLFGTDFYSGAGPKPQATSCKRKKYLTWRLRVVWSHIILKERNNYDYLALKIPADIKQPITSHTVTDQPEPEDGGCYPFGGESSAYKLCNTDMLQIVPAAYTDVKNQQHLEEDRTVMKKDSWRTAQQLRLADALLAHETTGGPAHSWLAWVVQHCWWCCLCGPCHWREREDHGEYPWLVSNIATALPRTSGARSIRTGCSVKSNGSPAASGKHQAPSGKQQAASQ